MKTTRRSLFALLNGSAAFIMLRINSATADGDRPLAAKYKVLPEIEYGSDEYWERWKANHPDASIAEIYEPDQVRLNGPTNPGARLAWRKRLFECRAGCEVPWRPEGYESTSGLIEYHFAVSGRGATPIEAIDNWYSVLPDGQFPAFLWDKHPKISIEQIPNADGTYGWHVGAWLTLFSDKKLKSQRELD